jgi:hypothetical protein
LRRLTSTKSTGGTTISGYPENAPASNEDELVETFVAGAISGRNMERDRLYGELVTYEGLSVYYDHYIKVQDILEMLDRDPE